MKAPGVEKMNVNVFDNTWHMPPNKGKALMLARRQLSELVWDAVNLEGINFTLPEIQTLLDGVTIGGRKITDQQIAINQAEAWRKLFNWVEDDTFCLSAEKVCELHAIAAQNEALEWGKFRSGSVLIAGTDYLPPAASSLPGLFHEMVANLNQHQDIYDQAITIFLTMARVQFFYDVNKRMGRFMMNGLLLSNGFPAINLPASRQLEFNNLMIDFYESGDPKMMNTFLRSCLQQKVIDIMKE
jgi:Fic family protein